MLVNNAGGFSFYIAHRMYEFYRVAFLFLLNPKDQDTIGTFASRTN